MGQIIFVHVQRLNNPQLSLPLITLLPAVLVAVRSMQQSRQVAPTSVAMHLPLFLIHVAALARWRAFAASASMGTGVQRVGRDAKEQRCDQ